MSARYHTDRNDLGHLLEVHAMTLEFKIITAKEARRRFEARLAALQGERSFDEATVRSFLGNDRPAMTDKSLKAGSGSSLMSILSRRNYPN